SVDPPPGRRGGESGGKVSSAGLGVRPDELRSHIHPAFGRDGIAGVERYAAVDSGSETGSAKSDGGAISGNPGLRQDAGCGARRRKLSPRRNEKTLCGFGLIASLPVGPARGALQFVDIDLKLAQFETGSTGLQMPGRLTGPADRQTHETAGGATAAPRGKQP